jgi:hypothetical protein
MCQDISLSRRVQLAVLAHIRHRHTRYDALLKETSWQHARKTVEAVCLDMIVKWRGDEENGRDTLDSLLREVVVISDSEGDDDSDDESDDLIIISPPGVVQREDAGAAVNSATSVPMATVLSDPGRNGAGAAGIPGFRRSPITPGKAKVNAKDRRRERRAAKKATRGFRRYQAAWQEAVVRSRDYRDEHEPQQLPNSGMQGLTSNGRPVASQPDPYPPAQAPYRPGHAHSSSDVIYLGPAKPAESANTEPYGAHGQYRTDMPSDAETTNRTWYAQAGARHGRAITPRPLASPSFAEQRPPMSHYQDLPVPSIEAPPSVSLGPQFVRPLQPRNPPRDVDADYLPRQPHPQSYQLSSDPAEAVPDGHYRRHRVISDRDDRRARPSDLYSPNLPQLQWNPVRHEPKTYQPISYPILVRSARDPAPHQSELERLPQSVGSGQQHVPDQRYHGLAGRTVGVAEHQRAQELRPYREYHNPGPLPEQSRLYRDPQAPVEHRGYLHQTSIPHQGDGHHARPPHDSGPRTSTQPIFVRTLEPRTIGVRDSRYRPATVAPPNAWEDEAAVWTKHPVRRRSPELYAARNPVSEQFVTRDPGMYEMNRPTAIGQRGVPSARPYVQEAAMANHRQQHVYPHARPYAGHDARLQPRDVIVIE